MGLYRDAIALISGDEIGATRPKRAPAKGKAAKPKAQIKTPKGALTLVRRKGKPALKGSKPAIAFARKNKRAVAKTVKKAAIRAKAVKKSPKLKARIAKVAKVKASVRAPKLRPMRANVKAPKAPRMLARPKAAKPKAPKMAKLALAAAKGKGGQLTAVQTMPTGKPADGYDAADDSDDTQTESGDDADEGDDGADEDGEGDDADTDDGSDDGADEGDEDEASDDADEDANEDDSDAESADSDEDGPDAEASGMSDEYVGFDEIAGDDDIGYDEIAGDDDYVGAAPRRRKVAKGRRGPNAALVRERGYSKARRQPVGFTSTGTVAAAGSATISVIPQTLFRGRKLVVLSTVAPSFTIDDVKVGNVSQLAASGSLTADAFGPTTTGEDNMLLDTCPPGMSISMTVTNTSAGALTFRSVLFGDSVQ